MSLDSGYWTTAGVSNGMLCKCSECGTEYGFPVAFKFNFCPNCGSAMRNPPMPNPEELRGLFQRLDESVREIPIGSSFRPFYMPPDEVSTLYNWLCRIFKNSNYDMSDVRNGDLV